MKKKTALAIASMLMLAALTARQVARSESAPDQAALIERGKYLVERVAMCIQCHSSRNEKGDLVEAQLFHGAAVPVKPPPYPYKDWALTAPNIAGLRGYGMEQGVRLLTEGVRPDGSRPRAPMPPYRFIDADARAVVTYLKSLP
jgi:mono/diheme cytochrome c family protein